MSPFAMHSGSWGAVGDEEALAAAAAAALIDGSGDAIAGIPFFEWLSLKKPARYLGKEHGAIRKDWDSARVRFCLTYPEVYEVGASNLGHIILYTVLNQAEGVMCDRAYFVDEDMSQCLKKYNKSLFAVESQRPLAQFDTLGFSLSYELGATNILQMLHESGIPISWQERMDADTAAHGGDALAPWDVSTGSMPLAFAGGPTATSNPEPFSDFFDFFAIGDGEECLVEIAQCLDTCKQRRLSRYDTLLELARSVKGVYVPQLYETVPGWGAAVLPKVEGVPSKVLRRVATPNPLDHIGLVPLTSTVHDRLTVEIRRGCTRGCRFCQPGMLTRPARDVDPDKVVEAVEAGMRKTGYTEFSLLSLSCSDYLALPSVGIQIKNRLKEQPISLSLPSQRVDRFNDDIANIIGGTRKGSITFAPEAGTQRMRDVINKGLTDEELLRGVKAAWDKGWRQVKLYFMIGLPGETDEDVLGIAKTIKWLQQNCRRGRNFLGVRLTISNFTPKPHTPFQWHTVSTAEFTRKQRLLRDAFVRMPGVKWNFGDVRLSAMEDFIGRGDRSIGRVIRRAWELGASNDAWWVNLDRCYGCWSQAIDECGLEWKYRRVVDGEWDVMEKIGDDRFRGQGGKSRLDVGPLADARLDAPLPWDIINTGIERWWLKADLQRALEATTVPDCSHSGVCSKCGVCEEDFGENVVAAIPPVPEYDGDFKPNRKRVQRLRVRFAKMGAMTLLGHLDTVSLLDRALRRADLPVCYDNGFHSLPRISCAAPLPLGHSSSCELVDLEFTQKLSVADVKKKLQEQLPDEVPVLDAWEEPIFRADKKNTDTLTKQLYAIEYLLLLRVEGDAQGAEGAEVTDRSLQEQVEEWVQGVLALPSFTVTLQKKQGAKPKETDLRARLHELRALPQGSALPSAMRLSCNDAAAFAAGSSSSSSSVVVSYVGQHTTDGGTLRPEGVLTMLSEVVALPTSPTLISCPLPIRVLKKNRLIQGCTMPFVVFLFFFCSCSFSTCLRLLSASVPGGFFVGSYYPSRTRAQGQAPPVTALSAKGPFFFQNVLNRTPQIDFAKLRSIGNDEAFQSQSTLLSPRPPPPHVPHASGLSISFLQIDFAKLRSIGNDEAFRSLYRRFDGTSRLNDTQPLSTKDAIESARQAALAKAL
ncbi:unnamed protein product [Closterium sp. Naga37s-1]|nr:unnamed protein product [Closterium sp. Naga37s-1]